jgi:hypothetical protein
MAAIVGPGSGAVYPKLLGWIVLVPLTLIGLGAGLMLIADMNFEMNCKRFRPSTTAFAVILATVAMGSSLCAADRSELFPDRNRPASLLAQEASVGVRRDRAAYRAWKWSLAPAIASQALDAASSWNMRELNPVLADGSGRFAVKAATLKFGLAGALVCGEYLLVRNHPGAARVLAKLNWSSAVVTGAFAAHNYAIK